MNVGTTHNNYYYCRGYKKISIRTFLCLHTCGRAIKLCWDDPMHATD